MSPSGLLLILASFLVGVLIGRQTKRKKVSQDPHHAHHRRVLDSYDFQLAEKYTRGFLKELAKQGTQDLDQDALEAFWAALVVSYGRPFAVSYTESREECLPCYRKELRGVVPEELRQPLHQQLINARNQIIAHSDPIARKPREEDWGVPFGKVTSLKFEELPGPQLQMLLREHLLDVIERLRKHSSEQSKRQNQGNG